MKKEAMREIEILIQRYPALASMERELVQAAELLIDTYSRGGKLLVCGNGGSAADSLHIVGELMKQFVSKRRIPQNLQDTIAREFPEYAELYGNYLEGAMPAISLVNEVSLLTAFGNDKAANLAFAQQVVGYGAPGDALIAISTSGNSENVLHAARIAKCMGVRVLSMTGREGGKLRELSDALLAVPSDITYQIQEYHLPIYHTMCLVLEQEMYAEN